MNPPITVLISTYNGEKTIDRCFESLKKQTFQDFRIVCIDDASTDKTGFILSSWKNIFSPARFTIISVKKNIGLTRALNLGLERITTPYTARIDDDDWWMSEKLERQMNFLKENPQYGIIGCSYINVACGKEKKVCLPETDQDIKKDVFYRNPFAHSCVVFQTKLIKDAGGYDNDIEFGQDYELWLRVSSQTKFYNIQKVLCCRNADSGISHRKQNAQMWQYVKTQCHYIRKLHRPFSDYRFIMEPLSVIITPKWIRAWKRKLL